MENDKIINRLIEHFDYKIYFEIGTIYKNDCFDYVNCKCKSNVSLEYKSQADYFVDTDYYFSFFGKERKKDIIFIDNPKSYEQLLRDLDHSLYNINDNGVILINKCLPKQKFKRDKNEELYIDCDCDIFKAWLYLRRTQDELNMFIIDNLDEEDKTSCGIHNHGVGVIFKGEQKLLNIKDQDITYDNLLKNKKKWMNTFTINEFESKFI